jgi:hypothetical protein
MRRRFYLLTRDLHLYAGLFISPILAVFACSVFLLVHPTARVAAPALAVRSVGNLEISPNLESLSGRARLEALHALARGIGVQGEIGFIRYVPKERRLSFPMSVPGRETRIDVDLNARTAKVTERATGLGDALIQLHKSPGPHLAELRMNWLPARIWFWLADGTAYLALLLSLSGVYLWLALRSERRLGIVMLIGGVLCFFGTVYGLLS